MTVLDKVVGEMRQRVQELAPAVEEHNQLQEALSNLGVLSNGYKSANEQALRVEARVVEETKLKAPSAKKRRRGRPEGSGESRLKILQAVSGEPGLRAAEIGEAAGLGTSNYVYKALKDLQAAGQVKKAQGRWFPTT